MTRPTLIVFARRPAIGVGKTRLAQDLGAVETWRFYRALSRTLLFKLSDPRWRLVVRMAGGRRAMQDWPAGLRVEPQGRGDLGRKLQRALRGHSSAEVAVIGTDAPDMTRALIAEGLGLARRRGLAFGPATDGGFWLLALSSRRARTVRLDRDIRWSHPSTLADTQAALGGKAGHVATLSDIDDLSDLLAWRRRQRR
ncbi:MAG: hypothetical protein RJA87_1460 [Pseudomonadota bacterium]|jgi:glycosyltransferase A (GT-A) superfamily protein (DUF2064 family)